jgi:hypothetical protein
MLISASRPIRWFFWLTALLLAALLLPLRPAALAAPSLEVTPTPTATVAGLISFPAGASLGQSTPDRRGAAVPGALVINEVVTDPQQDWSSSAFDGVPGVGPVTISDEYVELYIKVAGLDLSGWMIELTDDNPASGSLGAGGAFQVARYVGAGGFNNTLAGAYLVLGNPASGALNNTILIVLKDGDGQIIDQVQLGGGGAPDGAATGPSDESISRFPNGTDTGYDNLDFVQQAASLGRANVPGSPPPAHTATSTPTLTPTPTEPVPFASGIVLNEFLPRPAAGGQEFIELYNTSGVPADLSGWQLDDGPTGTSPHTLPAGTVIQPGGYLAFEQAATNVGLNDDGDTVRLLRPDGTTADEWAYQPAPAAGVSVARLPDGGAWRTDGIPTPGQPNQVSTQPSAPSPDTGAYSIAQFRSWPDGAWVTVAARVSVQPGTFSPRTIHLQDGTGGVTVYLGRNDWPPLALGQEVEVLGYLRHRSGELQLYVRNGWHIHPGPAEEAVPPAPWPALTGLVGQATEGALVQVTGRVTRLETSALWLDDGSGPARVFFAAVTGLPRPPAALGDTFTITGAVVEFTTSGADAPNYRLQPRSASDVIQVINGTPVPYVPGGTPSPDTEAPEPTATAEP